MNSWKLFGTAAAAALFVACSAANGQSCGSPLPASTGSTAVATTSGVTLDLTGLCDPGPAGDDMIYNVSWYFWVAPTTDVYQVDTCNTVNYDSRLAVLTSCSTPGSVLACNDDGGAGCLVIGTANAWASKLTFSANEGTTYYIAVGGYATGSTGSGSMTIATSGGGGGDPACGTVANDCCLSNATPFCSDADCCNLVCSFDSFCCTSAWDTVCAQEAAANCANCSGGGGCGTNDCCVANGTPGCSDADCCAAVCAADAFCCQTAWDAVCASESATLCAICGGGGGGGCGKNSNDCCLPNATPGCSDADCCATVCAADPFCCQTAWDNICATEAGTMCTICDTGAACGTATNDCCVASGNASAGCSDATCCAAVCAGDPFCCFQEWDAQCAGEAATTCTQCAPVCDGPSTNVTEVEPCGADMNGGCNDPNGAVQTINLGDIVGGTYYATTALRDTDWYEFTIGAGTQVTLNLYTSGPALVALTDNTCPRTIYASATTGCPRTATACLPAGTYRAVVLLSVFQDIPCTSGFASYVLETSGVPCSAEPPANDECDGSAIVAPGGGSYAFDTSFATSSMGGVVDPACEKGFGLALVKDVWYSWTPDQSGAGFASTCNQASFDTRMACYSDCDGTLVTCNDDGDGCGLTSRMDFAVTAGQTYKVRVGGFAGGGTGTVTFGFVQPITNDECETATVITNGSTAFDTTTATDSLGGVVDPACEEGSGLTLVKDIWFKYTATCTDTLTVSTCNDASFDTRLAAYSDCNGTLVACNDDGAGCGLTSSMAFSVTTNSIYYLRVGGFSGGGTGNLTITCGSGGGGVANDTCATPSPAVTGGNAFSNVGAISDAPTDSPANCGTFGTTFFNDVWFSYTPAFSGLATFSTCSSANFDTRLELWVGCPDSGGVLVACNDDGTGCSGFTSTMTATLSCNTKYLVRVGAYAATGFGSGTLNITPGTTPCANPCPEDFNNDGVVDGFDLGSVLGSWGPCVCPQDLNGDGTVDGFDLGQVLGAWGPCN